ncbi:hypothetical protein Bbelb_435620 [Branchiostoma belcheri]|nr:hypothetical protein Bbelb_435620 [Branchiostoma belcheri]
MPQEKHPAVKAASHSPAVRGFYTSPFGERRESAGVLSSRGTRHPVVVSLSGMTSQSRTEHFRQAFGPTVQKGAYHRVHGLRIDMLEEHPTQRAKVIELSHSGFTASDRRYASTTSPPEGVTLGTFLQNWTPGLTHSIMFLMPAFSAATVLGFLTGISLAQTDIGLTLPEQVNTVLGDPVTLAASYSTNRQVELLSWYKIDNDDPSKRVLVLSYSPMRGQRTYHNFVERVELVGPASLKILKTRVEDEGKYVLSLLVEEVGSVDGFVTLHILVVEVGPSNPYVIGLGKAALLTCTVMNAKPNISSLHWKKDGTIVDSNLMNTKFSGGTMASPSLMIRHVTRTDAGLYTCVADHVVKQERSKSGKVVFLIPGTSPS